MKWGSLVQEADNVPATAHAQAKSDPICSSAFPNCDHGNKKDGTEHVKYPVGHEWPLEGDVVDSAKNLKATETKLKSTFTVGGSKAQVKSLAASQYDERRNLKSMMMNNWGSQ